jgi:hypothetical protein
MNDMPKIIVGLAIALLALTFPFWRQIMAGRPSPAPRPDEPQFELPEGECVARDMKARHMQLLNEWRDAVVRDGDTDTVAITVRVDGEEREKEYPKSLTRGCMACHTSRQNFCVRCHDYADVDPNCWDCHVAPGEVKGNATEE